MDTVPPSEFFDVFKRMNRYIDSKGCKNKKIANLRVWHAYRIMQRGANNSTKKVRKR